MLLNIFIVCVVLKKGLKFDDHALSFFVSEQHLKNCWSSDSMYSWGMEKQAMPWKMALCA